MMKKFLFYKSYCFSLYCFLSFCRCMWACCGCCDDRLQGNHHGGGNGLPGGYLSYFEETEYKIEKIGNYDVGDSDANKIDIFFFIDDTFVYPCLVTIKSIIETSSPEKSLLAFYILVPQNFDYRSKIELFQEKENCAISIVSMKDKYSKLSTGRRWATPAYYRFSIPWISKKNKAIYLDSDLLIRHDLKTIFDIDVDDCFVVTIVDGGAMDKKTFNCLQQEVVFNRGEYFNSGVLLLNCKKIRENLREKLAELLSLQEQKTVSAF